MSWDDLRSILRDLLGDDDRPVVAYAGIYPLAPALPGPLQNLPRRLLELFRETAGPKRTLFMPSFTNGFKGGVIDLDHEPGNTGMVNELLRLTPGSRRTASAFFSFAGSGPRAAEAAALRPRDAWGDGSLYEWFERQDAHFLMVGVPRTNCSYLHRLEWLVRERIPYRYAKEFAGEMVREGRREALREGLFVRDSSVAVVNTWEHHIGRLEKFGMRSVPVGRGYVAGMGARAMVEALLPVVSEDPFAFVKDPESLRAHYASKTGRAQEAL